ncbi:uncharacterized protein LOC135955147 [Calliphora vicina]|uniref:uncharacterized protein LOC135955147 n=1 Tax=Calliphora vicina TaxID=7373 RepID=UPI00325A4B79
MKKSAVSSFLSSLKCVESNELNKNKLFKIYNENSPDELKVKKTYFRSIFNSKFNLEVKLPRKIVCSTCSDLSDKITTCMDKHLKPTFMAQKRIHSLKYKEFYKLLKDENPEILILSFDCQKKQVLPKVYGQAESNSTQLYFQNFTIVQGPSTTKLKRETVFIYAWTENQFSKNANLIASALHHRLQNTRFNDNIITLRLIADDSAGQNKNAIIIAMLLKWFSQAPSSLKQIELIFPIVGHSFLPAHRVFANAEKRIKKIENILFPEEYEKVLTEFGSVLKIIDVCSVEKWKDVSKEFLQPPRRWHFKFSTTNKFFLRKTHQGEVVITGEENYRTHVNQNKYRSICKKDFKLENIQPELIQPYSVKINSLKVRYVSNLMEKLFGQHWQNYENLKFYADFVNNYQQQIVVADDTHEEYCSELSEEAPL